MIAPLKTLISSFQRRCGVARALVMAAVIATLSSGGLWGQTTNRSAVNSAPPQSVPPASTEPSAEDALFEAALKALETGGELVKHAEAEFAAFVGKFPNSGRIPEAFLRRAQCRFKLNDPQGALTLLESGQGKAGKLADEYLFWIAESWLRLGQFEAAEKDFARLLKEHPGSARALEASYGQAEAVLKRKDYDKVITLLRDPKGAFRVNVARRPKDEAVSLGLLALGEALLSSGRAQEYATGVSSELFERIESDANASIELKWRWHLLEYRNAMAEKQYDSADVSANNLIHLSAQIVDAEWRAESIERKAEVMIALNRADEAVETYRLALAPEIPLARRREAMDRIVDLRAAQNKNVEGIAYLRMIATNFPSAPDLDQVHLRMGELGFEEFAVNSSGATNLTPALLASTTNYLGLAKAEFDAVIQKFTNSVYQGRALLRRGECFELVGEDAKALADFSRAAAKAAAVTNLALRARAFCKAGDASFKLTNYLAAATNYQAALDGAVDLPEVKAELGGRAVYQMANAAVRLMDLRLARTALNRLRADFAGSEFHGRAALMVGQALNDAGEHDQALEIYIQSQEAIGKSGMKSSLTSELMLASAATYSSKGDWPHAIAAVEAWIAAEDNVNDPLKARAEFELGRLNALSGSVSNAFGIYTNFVETRKTNQLSAHAHLWLGDFYFNQGADSAHLAEKHYQLVFQNTNWPASDLTWRAQFQAGRCATLRQGRNEARDFYFSKLAENKNAPGEWRARALFAIGDTFVEEGGGPARWTKAINVFNEIVDNHTNAMVHPLALGRIGDCNLQLAGSGEPKRYDDAAAFYRRVMDHPAADVSARCRAAFALGSALEGKARLATPPDPELLGAAREQWSAVYRSKLVNPDKGERPDVYWRERSALALARSLAESGDAATSVAVLRGLKRDLPHLQSQLEREIRQLTERSAKGAAGPN